MGEIDVHEPALIQKNSAFKKTPKQSRLTLRARPAFFDAAAVDMDRAETGTTCSVFEEIPKPPLGCTVDPLGCDGSSGIPTAEGSGFAPSMATLTARRETLRFSSASDLKDCVTSLRIVKIASPVAENLTVIFVPWALHAFGVNPWRF